MAEERYEILVSGAPLFPLIVSGLLSGIAISLFIIFLLVGAMDVFAGSESKVEVFIQGLKSKFFLLVFLGSILGGVGAIYEKNKIKKGKERIWYLPIAAGLIIFLVLFLSITFLMHFSVFLMVTVSILIFATILFIPSAVHFYRYLQENLLVIFSRLRKDFTLQKEIFIQEMEREFSRTRRRKGKLSIAFIDFYNKEELESSVGSRGIEIIVREILDILQKNMRRLDIFSIWEEGKICGLLIDTPEKKRSIAVERMKNLITAHTFHLEDMRVEVVPAFGLSSYKEGITSKEELIEKAEEELKKNMVKK